MNEEPLPEEDEQEPEDNGLTQLRQEVDSQGQSIQSLNQAQATTSNDVLEIFKKLNDIWPGSPTDVAASGGNLIAYWVVTDGGDPGDALHKCSLTYTIYALAADGSGPVGDPLDAGASVESDFIRGKRGKMAAGNKAIGYASGGAIILLLVDETSIAAKFIPVTIIAQTGGSDGDDTTFANWRYSFGDLGYDAVGLVGIVLSGDGAVLKPRLSFGSVEPAAAGSTAIAIDYGDGTFQLWDVGEVYESGSCASLGGGG